MTTRKAKPRPTQKGAKKEPEPARKGAWIATHPDGRLKNRPLYKVLSLQGKAQNGGSFDYGNDPVGKVFEVPKGTPLIMCGQGFHLTSEPKYWSGLQPGTRTFLAAFWLPAGEKAIIDDAHRSGINPSLAWCLRKEYTDNKIVCRRIKILAEVKPRVVRAPKLPVISIRKGKDGVPVVSVTDAVPGVLGLSAAKPKKGTPTRATIDAKLAKGLAALKAKKKEVAKAAAALSKEAGRLRKRAGQLEDTSYELEDAMDGLPEAPDLWE